MRDRFKPLLRRLLAPAAAFALLTQTTALAAGPAVPEGYRSPFPDVEAHHWFYPFVASLNSRGVVAGHDDGRFGPNDPTRAGDAMVMVLRAAGATGLAPLQDAHYAAAYAAYAVEQGWLTWAEVPQELNGPVSRLFIARLAAKALGLVPAWHGSGAAPFADVDDGYITALYQKGIVAGSRDGDKLLFKPERSITRAEVSTIVWQVLRYSSSIHFGSYTLDVLEGVPASPYRPEYFRLEGDRMSYWDGVTQADLGVDVSSHQGEIDWEQAAGDGIRFAMLRAGGRYYGSGGIFEDAWFRENLRGAHQAGLEVGVYFFSQATSPEEAREEAQFLLEVLDGYPLEGPVVFDWENIDYDQARTDGMDAQAVTAAANAFCSVVESGGYRPMIYFNQYIAYLLYDLEEVAQYPFWLAQYGTDPEFYYHFQMWQYTDQGRVAGIDGPADMNLRLVPW